MKDKVNEIYESDMDFESLSEEQEVILNEEDIHYSGDLKVVASENPYVLGKLVGTFMEIENDNGNGRLYPLETIKTRVVELPYTKRMMEHKSLLGEAHHPLERTNIWMDESAISTTKLTISSDGKRLIGEADILDTPKGRIVNTLARYGTDIGVSARATGKGTKRNGHLVITPDKYFFKTFDAVLNPGFETARPSKKEPDGSPMQVCEENEGLPTLYEELKMQIEQNKCDKKMLDYYINYSGDESLKDLQSLFEDVATDNTLENKGDDSMTESEVKDLQEQVKSLNEENESLKAKIQNLSTDIDYLQERNSLYEERLAFVNEESEKSGLDAQSQVDELLDILYQQKNQIYGLNEELKDLQFRYAGLSSEVLNLTEEQKESDEEKVSLSEQVEDLKSGLEDYEQVFESLTEDQKDSDYNNSLLTAKIEDLEKSLDEEVNKNSYLRASLKKVRETQRSKVIPKSIDLFKDSVGELNEEVKEDKSAIRRQVSLIKSVGGK